MSNQVTLTINSKSVTVAAGTSVIQAAKDAGVEIPHFCWHPGLSIAGVCRFCMVKVEGIPKLQIACNTVCTEGMKVDTNAPEVKDAHKWALEFHLINHPLDCPICDQAGECELQNYYMKVGKYNSQMEEDKVLKPKALDIGDTLILDTERCILCSRCVRFEDEVTKTSALGIFNRGDRAVIGTFPNRRVSHNYTYNIADICPVGAFTAKDFRFKCRVWFLQETPTVCPGCSTGCNVTLFENKSQRQYYRLKPRYNPEVNGHWMCDYGRTMFEHLNADQRIAAPELEGRSADWLSAIKKLAQNLQAAKTSADKVALVLTPQYTNEEYEVVLTSISKILGQMPKIYVWRDGAEKADDFDGLLFRGDKNPNTYGLNQVLSEKGVTAVTLSGDFAPLATQAPTLTLILGPEVEKAYSQFESDIQKLSELSQAVYFGSSLNPVAKRFSLRIPTKVFAEKSGTFMNFAGRAQKLKANPPVFPSVRGVDEVFSEIAQNLSVLAN